MFDLSGDQRELVDQVFNLGRRISLSCGTLRFKGVSYSSPRFPCACRHDLETHFVSQYCGEQRWKICWGGKNNWVLFWQHGKIMAH